MTRQFHDSTPVIFMELRQLCREVVDAADSADRTVHLVAMQRKLGFLAQMAGLAGYPRHRGISREARWRP